MCSILLFLAYQSICRPLLNLSFSIVKFQPKLKRTENAVLVHIWLDLVFMHISTFAHLEESFTAWVESLEMGVMGWEWPRKRSGNREHLRGIFLGPVPPFQAWILCLSWLRTPCMETEAVWQTIVAGSILIRGTDLGSTGWLHGKGLDFGFCILLHHEIFALCHKINRKTFQL